MKKIFTLTLCMLQYMIMMAAEPTVPSSNFVFSSIDGTRYTVRFTQGNGANRIVVMKAGSAVTGAPVNGTDYTFNNIFGTANTLFTAANEYVVYKGNSNTFAVSNLLPGTVYHLAVYEYNGSGVSTQYLQVALNGSQPTSGTPTTQTNTFSFSSVTGNSGKINWNNGNGEGRLVLARKGSPVNATPEDLKDYTASLEFGTGNVINTDNYVMYKATGNTATITSLEPNTTYHFAFFEKNGSSYPMYLRPGATTSFTTNAGPTVQTQSLSMSSQEGNRFTVTCSRGNGSRRLYIIRKGAAVTAVPVNGHNYTANAAFGSGEAIAPGEYVVNNSSESAVIITNLEPASVYYVRSFEFDIDAAGNTYYLTSNPAANNFSTASAPNPVSNITYANVTGNTLQIKYTAGNGGYRMVMMRESVPVNGVPQNLIRYNGNGSFGNGDMIPTGNYVVNGGANGTATNVTNLRPGFTYHFAVYEFSGNNYPVYSTPVISSITMPAEPTAASTAFFKNLLEGNSFRANWTSGDGTRRIVVARKNSAVTALPADGVTYTANSNFGAGTAIAADQFVVYDGVSSVCDIKNLEIGATYHLAVFEYNSPGGAPDYLTGSFLSGNATTLTAPTTQVVSITPGSIQSNSVNISFAAGNGGARIFIMREGAPVNVEPTDLVNYSYSTVYGITEIGSANYVVQKATTTSSFAVTNLNPNTTYHIAAFEYNGSAAPVFKKPAAVVSFTTSNAAGVVAPTLPATAALINGVEGNKLTFKCTEGNGSGRLIIARAGSPVSFLPADGTVYSGDGNFGAGTQVSAGEYVVYSGTANSVNLSSLVHSTTYHFAVFEFNGTGSNTRYLTSSFLTGNGATFTAPVTGSTNANKSFSSTTISLNWQNGSGSGRMVILKEGSAVASNPANYSVYPASSSFGTGAQIGVGEYVVYFGTANNVTVTGLTPNKTYYYSILEYNGLSGPVYNTVNALTGSAITSISLPVTWLYFNAVNQSEQALLKWGTASEQNSAFYVIERNTGNGYSSIDTVRAAGNSSTDKHYTYTDRSALNGTVLYRLKQVDIDGKFVYSAVVNVKLDNSKQSLSVFPNPATTSVQVKIPAGNANAKLWIYDSKGSMVKQGQITTGLTTIDLSNLKAGVYFLSVELDGKKMSQQFVKN